MLQVKQIFTLRYMRNVSRIIFVPSSSCIKCFSKFEVQFCVCGVILILQSKRIVELRRTIHLKIHADTKTGPSWCSSASADYYHNYLIFSYGSNLWKHL